MNNIIEINKDDLEKKFAKFPVGTLLVCKNEDKIYTYLCKPTSIEKPLWTLLACEDAIERAFMSKSITDKVKWLLIEF